MNKHKTFRKLSTSNKFGLVFSSIRNQIIIIKAMSQPRCDQLHELCFVIPIHPGPNPRISCISSNISLLLSTMSSSTYPVSLKMIIKLIFNRWQQILNDKKHKPLSFLSIKEVFAFLHWFGFWNCTLCAIPLFFLLMICITLKYFPLFLF